MKRILLAITLLVVVAPKVGLAEVNIGELVVVSGEMENTILLASETKDDFSVETRFQPKMKFQKGKVGLVLEGDFRADQFSNDSVNRLNDQEERWAIGLGEVYADYTPVEWSSFRVGRQIFDWSVTDTVSPSDLLTPFDLTRPIDRERIAVPAISVKLGEDSKFLEAVAISKVTPSRLPQGNWDLFADLPANVSVVEQESASRAQLAVRGKYLIGDWDMGLVLYDGVGFSPNARIESSPFGARLVPFYDEVQAGVASVAKEFFGSIVRAELGFFDHEVGDDFWSYVVSVDREFSDLFRDTDHLYVLIQYSDQVVANHGEKPEGWVDFRRIFDNSVTLKSTYDFDDTDTWSLSAEWAHAIDDSAGYGEVSLLWKNHHWEIVSMEIETGINIFYGSRRTFWGGYNNNSPLGFIIIRFIF